jgi:hypothetical protein
MEISKSLIIGWSIVWGLSLVALTSLKSTAGISLISLMTLAKDSGLSPLNIVYRAPVYVFLVWAIGCILIISISWFITRKRK